MAYLGITVNEIVGMYSGTSSDDFGGDSVIEEALDAHTENILGVVSPEIYERLKFPNLQLVVYSATQGQTTATLGLTPIIANTTKLWMLGDTYTNYNEFEFGDGAECYRNYKFYEVATEWTLSTIDLSTGVITFPALGAEDRLYATYETDLDNIVITSLARAVRYGTAYEIGSKVYAVDTNQWKLVEEYKYLYENAITRITSKQFIPAELRNLRWLEPIQMQPSMRVFRKDRNG